MEVVRVSGGHGTLARASGQVTDAETEVGRVPASPYAAARDAAWLALLPCACVLVVAIALLGRPLGDALFPDPSLTFWEYRLVRPEPTEHARFLLALLGPILLSGAVVLAGRRPAALPHARVGVRAAELLLLAFLAFVTVAQHWLTYDGAAGSLYRHQRVYFTVPTLLVALAIAGLLVAALRSPRVVARARAATQETRPRRIAALAAAILWVLAWMLTAFNTEGSIGRATRALHHIVPLWLDEAFAVLGGVYPLVDFHAQYGHLSPYVTAGVVTLAGGSFGIFSGTMVAGTSAAMLAVFATFRRVVRSSLVALALFVPFVATSFFIENGTLANRYGPSNLFSIFPIRYGGPFVLAWLLSRHLDDPRPRRRMLLFFVAGLVLLNNPEFGIPALGATLAALGWTLERTSARSVARLAGEAALGLLAALGAVTVLTLAVAGSAPDLTMLFEFSRIFGVEGFGMLPMPAVGFQLAIYVTFGAAIVLATVRAVGRDPDVVLTGMLCWIGIFGLGASSYYAGRSHPEVLIDIFSPWAFAVTLLLVASVRAVLRRPRRTPTAAELAVFAGFGLSLCSVAQTATPWSQIERLNDTTAHPRYRPSHSTRFVAAHTDRGDRVVIMLPLGHRTAWQLGIENAFPYADLDAIPTVDQWRAVLDEIREQGIDAVFVPTLFNSEMVDDLRAAGFRIVAADRRDAQVAKLAR